MQRIETYLELLERTLEKYEGAEKLSRKSKTRKALGCRYSHHFNGIGCAIGCHISANIAKGWDTVGSIDCVYSFPVYKMEVEQYFNMKSIDIGDMALLQNMHDNARDVDHFRAKLRDAIEHEKARLTPADGA